VKDKHLSTFKRSRTGLLLIDFLPAVCAWKSCVVAKLIDGVWTGKSCRRISFPYHHYVRNLTLRKWYGMQMLVKKF